MTQEDTSTKQAQKDFDRSGFGLLVADLMARNPAMTRGAAVRQIARTYPEAHALYIQQAGGEPGEPKADSPEYTVFKQSAMGQAAIALVREGIEPTIEAATVRIMRDRPDLHEKFLNDLENR